MSKNLALSFRIDADTAAALRQLQGFQRQLAAVTGVKPMGNPFNEVASGAASTKASLGGMLAQLAAVAGAVAAVGSAFRSGFNVNAQTESATLGIKGLVAAMYDVRDAGGALATGPQQLALAGAEAEKQVRMLRVAGMETSATFEQLLGAFQGAVGAGAASGLKLDEIRELTVGIVQAAGALTVPMSQINQEVRSILSGQVTADSTVAKSLQITNEQLKRWQEAGTLAENLNKRLDAFRRLGPEAGKTWEATLSNVSDAFAMFLGGATEDAFSGVKTAIQQGMSGAFDSQGQLSAQFKDLQDAAGVAFSGIGTALADAISGGVDLAKDLSAWFARNADEVLAISHAFGEVYENVKGVVSSLVSGLGSLAGMTAETGMLRTAFGGIALLVALIQDGFRLWQGVIADVGATIIDKIGGPLKTVLSGLRDFLALIPGIGGSLASAVDSLVRAIPASGAGLRNFAKGIQADFDAGRTAVARTNRELSKTAEQLKAEAAARARVADSLKTTAAGGTATPKRQAAEAGKEAKRAADQYAQALRAYAEAEIDAARKVATAQREVAGAELEEALAKRLTTQTQYLQKKAALDREANAAEITAARAKMAVVQGEIARETDPAKRKKAEGDLVKLQADIKALEAKGIVIDTKLRVDLDAFKREVESLRVDIKANILDLEGNTLGAGRARLEKETQDLLRDPRVAGDADMQAAVNRQSQLKADRLAFDEQQRLISARADAASLAEERISLAAEQGKLTAIEAERAVRAERLKQSEAILANVAALEALAAANSGNADLAGAAIRARLEYDKLRLTLDATATSINGELASAGAGFVESIVRGESAIRSLGNALSSVFGNLAKRVLKEFEDSLFSALQGGKGQGLGGLLSGVLGSSGGGASVLSGLGSLLGFAGGGWTGPGGKYQPAGIVHADEYVFTKAEVRRAGGPGFFYDLKRKINAGPRMRGYAEGGLVGGGMAGVVQQFNPTFNPNINVAPALYLNPDDMARALGRNPIFGRDVARVVFEDNGSKLGR